MKNQYFGDLRDLFKYDLILHILDRIDLQQLTFIPMLTKNDSLNEGNKRDFCNAKSCNSPGTGNGELVKFLEQYKDVTVDERSIGYIESHFNSAGHKISIYNGQKGLYFEQQVRKKYFSGIPDESLIKSLIFIDPDIGLEVQRSREKHLLYSEAKSLYNRMDQNSIIMIYQHFPRIKHRDYLSTRSQELKELTAGLPLYISDNEIIFFFLAKNENTKNLLEQILRNYKNKYKRLIINV
ncbi:hypothetical protein FXV91_17565 [Methanosarcina sp. DH2]|jgi:hypothetical protein|uniref:hypothetical protein n=1 Tax=Methanosarcina sp. DH2 TaxID=2605639 RepID=UPI001E50DF82|nr:hypothetical protein [Methanosarcina sp. DH2]MCC4771904.1 hypothetical protein [Methanosarcina sp. DH2]